MKKNEQARAEKNVGEDFLRNFSTFSARRAFKPQQHLIGN